MDAELAFARALLADPHDAGLRLIYADWLEEQGRVTTADLVRESWGWEARVILYCVFFSRPVLRGRWAFVVESRESQWPPEFPALVCRRLWPHDAEFLVRADGTSPDSPDNWAWLLSLALDHGLALPGLDAPEAADGR